MIASPTLLPATGRGRFFRHGRLQQRPSAIRPDAERGLDIFEIARRRAREFGRVAFVISHWSNNHWNVRFADSVEPAPDDIIEYVAWPPGWRYRPHKENRHG